MDSKIITKVGFALATMLAANAFAQPVQHSSNIDEATDDLAYHSPKPLDSSAIYSPWEASYSESGSAKTAGNSYGYEKILVGLEVRGRELIALDIVKSETDYLIPIEQVFPVIGASFKLENGVITVSVPGTEVEIPAGHSFRIDGELWLGLSTLNDYLRVNGDFDESKYALTFLPPWSNKSEPVTSSSNTRDIDVDFKPDAFSLRQFRLSHEIYAEKEGGPLDFKQNNSRSEILGSGAAAGGSWLLEAEKNSSGDWRLDEYFWLKRDDKEQWLIGKQVASPSVVSPTVTITGAQYFYSNKSLPFDPYQDISQSRFFRELGTSVQKIRGNAEAGAVAQLFVNNQLIGETFVRLDGTYDFGEVRSESGLYNEIEVVVLDAISRTELERQNKTRLSSESLLSEGQIVTSVAYGKKGNWLDPDFEDNGEAGVFLYRYGLSDETTLEAGYLLDDVDTKTAGVASSLGSHFVGAYRAAWRNDALTQQLELDGSGKKWRASTFVRQQEAGFYDHTDGDLTTANTYFYYTPETNLRLELIGRYQDRKNQQSSALNSERVSFIKPGVFYGVSDNFSVAMRADYDGAYRTELYYRPNFESRFRVTHKPDEQTVRFDHGVNENVQSYMSGRMYKDTIENRPYQNTIIESAAGFYWRSSDWTSYDHLRVEINHSNEYGAGMFAEYRKQVASGVYLDLRVREADPQYDGGLSVFARVSMDFAVAGDKFVPATHRRSYNTNGTIAGSLNTGSDSCDMEHVSVLVNGSNYKVPVQGCTFYLEKVTPGIHRVALDGEFLPIELVPDTKSYIVEVGASAVTRVDFDMDAKYSAAGQATINGEASPQTKISVFDKDGNLVMSTYTDQFGYFRVDGLGNGDYQLQAINDKDEILGQRPFSVNNNFLFGVDIELVR
ncbi:hypothetical protein GCM10009123_10950 [Kangiella japonica]|uniref:Outer membrane usher protein FimD/PapC n=1 Tax=Kangiella japonica TaxID=647384 RepID=A0ABN0SXI6_9GAMM